MKEKACTAVAHGKRLLASHTESIYLISFWLKFLKLLLPFLILWYAVLVLRFKIDQVKIIQLVCIVILSEISSLFELCNATDLWCHYMVVYVTTAVAATCHSYFSRNLLLLTKQKTGEELIGMLNPMAWCRGSWNRYCNGYTSFCNPLFKLHSMGNTVAGTTWSGRMRLTRSSARGTVIWPELVLVPNNTTKHIEVSCLEWPP